MKMDFSGMKFEGFRQAGYLSDKLINSRPPAAWAQQDPADSLYRVAREALNRGEYRRGAQLFSEIHKKYPRSQYAVHSAYWEAFARYRVGGTDDLKEALKILEERIIQFASPRRASDFGAAGGFRAPSPRGLMKGPEAAGRCSPSRSPGSRKAEVRPRRDALARWTPAAGAIVKRCSSGATSAPSVRRESCTRAGLRMAAVP